MNCVACGEQNREGRKFCAGCGARLSAACPACGTANEPGERFCGECGVPLAAADAGGRPQGAAGAAHRAEGERSSRKVVTIIFGDLVGSTALHERLDAESVRQFMEGYYAAMRGAVEAHGGRVTQVMGDGVKAVFGAPRVAEDDAIRAVRAAVEMQHAFRALAEQQSGHVGSTGLRVAVNTGEVVTDDDTEIIGDPVNVAARLQEQGKDGDVVIGGSTQRIVGALVTLDRLGSFALKGRAEQVEAFRVVSLEPPAGAKKSAFVGRVEELARLGDVYETAVAKPAAGLAVLLGSPGLGKTRLIDEFARRLGDDASVITAHCDSSGGATFAPIVAALRAHLGIEDGARPEAVRAAVEALRPGEDAERARIVGGVTGLLSGSPASPEETFFVIRRLLAALAAAKPVVLVIDDLQWAEPLLLDLVEHLVQWGSGVRLLVLVGARPELRDVRSSLASPGGFVADVLTLSGLDAGAAMRLAAGVIGATDLPAALAAKLLATSEGNPLFVAELVKMLVQEGVLEQRGERWVASAALADLEMPPTIHALLAARIERLRPEERTVLERAAVVGRIFSRSAVAALLRETGDLDARLEALRRSEVIERDAGWFLGEPVLRFHHVLIRDAAYRRVLKGTRAELHARLADWIEGKVGDTAEHDETIGRHLEQAHQHLRELGPLDAKGIALGERAARRLAAAGRRALGQDDVALAASQLGRAIACLPSEATERADLALDWCEALLSAGDVGHAGTAIEELDRLGADAPRLRAWHTCFAGQLRTLSDSQGLQATAEGVAAAAQALAGLGDAAGEAKAHHVHALTLARLGQVGGCEAALDRALAAARRAGDHRRSNAVLAGAPRAALWGPSPVTRASGRCLDVVRVLRITQGAPAVEAVALSCQGVLEALRGRTDAAKRMIASARKMVEELGIAQRLFEADVFAGRVALLEGDASAAEQNLRGAYEGLRDLGLGIDAAQAAALLARALLAQGRAAEAEALSHESETLAGDDLQAAIAWRGARAEALAQRGEHGAAVTLAQAAVEIAAATDALLDHADARVALAAALRAAGRGGEADAEQRRARELWETKGATLLVERGHPESVRVDSAGSAPKRLSSPRASRMRPNAATALRARMDDAIATQDFVAVRACFADDFHEIDHPTGSTYGAGGAVASLERLFRSRDVSYRVEPLATLGPSLSLVRRHSAASGASGRRYDVGAYENEVFALMEVDERGVYCRSEAFAGDRLGDAMVRLYQRYAELQPEGPERERAAVCARSLEAFVGPLDRERWAAAMAPEIEQLDHRILASWSARGASEALGHLDALLGLTTESAFGLDELLAATPSAWLDRRTHAGIDRESGGAYERAFLCLSVTGADGHAVRLEFFDPEREAEALARFDELTGGVPKPSLQRRVRANATAALGEQLGSALATRDAAALDRVISERLEFTHHSTGTSLGKREFMATWRSAFRAEQLGRQLELLATLGDSLALGRESTLVSGLVEKSVASFGPSQIDDVFVLEDDGQGQLSRIDTFALDRLGNAITRLFERHAELLPEGPARTRAEATAGSVAALLAQPPDLERWNTALSSEIEQFDQRGLALFGSLEGSAMRGLNRAMFELENFAVCIDDVLGLTPAALLFVATTSGTSRNGGGAFERQMVHLWGFDEGGLLRRAWRFDAESEAEALAQFDALVGGDADPAAEPFANAASRADDRFAGCFNARDWPGILAGVAPELVFDERRRLSRNTAEREVWLEQLRVMFDLPERHFTIRLLATRGERLSLHRHEFGGNVPGGGGPLEMEPHLALHEVDREGRIVAIVLFDLENLDAAYAELDARFDAGEGAAHPLAARWYSTFSRAVAERNWDELAATTAPELVARDHKLVGWGELRGPAQWLRALQSMVELAPDVLNRQDHVRTSSRGALFQLTWLGSRDGGPFEIPVIGVVELDAQGRQLRLDIFDPGKLDFARAHFAQIGAGAPSPEHFENAASRAWAGLAACWETHDSERFAALLPAEFHYVDRNRMARLELDRAGYLDYTRLLREMRSIRVARETLATRGERLALTRSRLQVAGADVGPSEIVSLFVSEANERGEIATYVRFDPDDEAAAYDELDARFAAGEGGAAWGVDQAFVRAIRERDWDAAVACLAPGFVEHDRRGLAVLGTTHGAEAWVRNFRTLVELAPDTQFRTDHFRPGERGFVTVGPWHGSQQGGDYELPLVVVVELDDRGRFTRTDLYDPEQIDAARARFAQIEAGAASPERFANAATRANERGVAAIAARDPDGFAALIGAEFRLYDRTRTAQLEVGREQWLAAFRPIIELTASPPTRQVLATRGDRLALVRMLWQGAGGDVGSAEIEWLLIHEVDDRGEHIAIVRFEPDDLDAAYAELDARHEAGEGASHAAAAWLRDFGAALERRDWDGVASVMAPDFVGEDHRLVSWGTLHGPAGILPSLREMVALAPDARLRKLSVRTHERGFITDSVWVGTREGGAFESPFVCVLELGAEGRARRLDFYDPQHLDRALARFEEVRASAAQDPPAALAKPNAASGWLGRFQAAFNRRDWDVVPTLYAPDVAYEDRQRFSQLSGGLDMVLSSVRVRAKDGARVERIELLGTAGDRIAIQRMLWAGGGDGDGFEMEFIVVQQVDSAGRLVVNVNFDSDDARAAQREAWKLWARLDPAAVAVATPMGELVDAFNAHDRDRWRAQFADEIVVEDHRRTGFGRIEGADAYADSLTALWELAPETTVETGWHWPAIGRHGVITQVRRTGVIPDGGAFESDYLTLYTVSSGRITYFELFELEALDAALARFEELRPDPLRIPSNAAVRAFERVTRLREVGRLDELGTLASGDFVFDDRERRSLVRGGVAEWQRALDFLTQESGARPEARLVATAGERLALHHVVWRDPSDRERFETDAYRLIEFDAEGKLRALVLFDGDAKGAAFDELADRWERQPDAPPAPLPEFVRAWNAHDLDRLRALYTGDFVFDDHRRTGIGRVDREGQIASLAALYELSPDVRLDVLYFVAQAPHGLVSVTHWWGTNSEGGAFESVFATVAHTVREKVRAIELFEPEDLEAALARFEALRSGGAE